jgi:hypothetical protein
MVRKSSESGLLTGNFFINDLTGWTSGLDGIILKTTNGGINWEREKTNTINDLREIFFVDEIGYVVGGLGTVLKNEFTPLNCNIKLLSPNGSEEWDTGSTQSITWESEGVTDIKIEYSYNNGASWNEITSSYPSTGIFERSVPNILSNQVIVRISDKHSINVVDESKNTFRIVKED